MFSKTVDLETLFQSLLYDIFQQANGVLAELTRVRMMAIRHVQERWEREDDNLNSELSTFSSHTRVGGPRSPSHGDLHSQRRPLKVPHIDLQIFELVLEKYGAESITVQNE